MALPAYNLRFILLISASFITIFSSIAIYFCLPILISHVIRTQISLSPSSGSFNDWRLNSVIDKIYLYNITNINDLLQNEVSSKQQGSSVAASKPILKLKQIGPFTFRQDREKLNIKFDSSNETVVYDQKKSWTFLPDQSSIKTLEDLNSTWIYHMNVPLAGTTLATEYAEFIDPIVREFDLKLFLNHSVNELLFQGYFDILMEQAKSGGQIDVDRFGWMHNQNNSITKGIRIFTGPSNATLNKFGSIDQINNHNRFDIWHYNNTEPKDTSGVRCNDFRLTSPGEFFPPPRDSIISHNNNQGDQQTLLNVQDKNAQFLSNQARNESFMKSSTLVDKLSNDKQKKSNKTVKTISIIMPDLCRVFKLFYNRTYNYKDLYVDRYIANEFTYDYTGDSESSMALQNQLETDGDDNRCFCIYNENTKLTSCPPNGMMDLYTCRKGSPLTISFPHFLYSNKDKTLAPYLKLFEDEVEPNESEHQFFIDLESTLNIPVKAQVVIQFNVHYRNEPSLKFTEEYPFLVDTTKFQASSSVGSATKAQVADFYLPQMWVKSTVEIDERNLANLIFIQQHLKFVTPLTTITIFCFASILLIMSAKLAYNLTYGPKSRKSMSRDQESCSSLNRNEHNSYLDDKQKYYALQLLGDEKSRNKNIGNNHHGGENNSLDKPTTSRADDLGCESQPLNG